MPAAPAPRNWEEVTRQQRRIRGRITATRDKWDARCLSKNLFGWKEISGEIKQARGLEAKIEGVFVRVFDYLVEFAFDVWADYTGRTVKQRKQVNSPNPQP